MKVRWYIDFIYEVIDEDYNQLYKGSLSDCEAFISLTERGYL